MWCLSEIDAAYAAKMEDVLALYEKPYDPEEPVVCLDEKPVSLHAEVRPRQAARPGVIAKRDSEYRRCGTANVFWAVEPKAGRHFTYPTATRSGAEFAQVVEKLAGHYPRARTIHLVVDNLNIHCQKPLIERFGAERAARLWERFALHYTPKHGSWLNLSRDRDQPVLAPMLGLTPHRESPHPARRGQSLEPADQSRPRHHPLELHPL